MRFRNGYTQFGIREFPPTKATRINSDCMRLTELSLTRRPHLPIPLMLKLHVCVQTSGASMIE